MFAKTFGQKIVIITTLIILIWMTIAIILYKRSTIKFMPDEFSKVLSFSKTPEEEIKNCNATDKKLSPAFWRKINYHEKEIPQVFKYLIASVVVQTKSVTVQNSKVHCIYAKPTKQKNNSLSVLLLHGQAYTSETWNELGTIKNIAAFGYYTVAVDLPGYGHSPAISNLDKTEFLNQLITELKLENPVVVSPSMSGSFSLNLLVHHSDRMAGFVPISPVGSHILDETSCTGEDQNFAPLNDDCQKIKPYLNLKIKPPNLSCIKVPTLVVFGEKDRGENSAKLCLLPNSQGAEIPEGEHSAYLSKPELWHQLLYNFLHILSETLACR